MNQSNNSLKASGLNKKNITGEDGRRHAVARGIEHQETHRGGVQLVPQIVRRKHPTLWFYWVGVLAIHVVFFIASHSLQTLQLYMVL